MASSVRLFWWTHLPSMPTTNSSSTRHTRDTRMSSWWYHSSMRSTALAFSLGFQGRSMMQMSEELQSILSKARTSHQPQDLRKRCGRNSPTMPDSTATSLPRSSVTSPCFLTHSSRPTPSLTFLEEVTWTSWQSLSLQTLHPSTQARQWQTRSWMVPSSSAQTKTRGSTRKSGRPSSLRPMRLRDMRSR